MIYDFFWFFTECFLCVRLSLRKRTNEKTHLRLVRPVRRVQGAGARGARRSPRLVQPYLTEVGVGLGQPGRRPHVLVARVEIPLDFGRQPKLKSSHSLFQ